MEVLGHTSFWLLRFSKTAPLDPKSSDTGHLFWEVLVMYRGHGIFHPGVVAVLLFSRAVFRREVLSSHIEEPQKKKVVPLYRIPHP